MMTIDHLFIGAGQIGSALSSIFSDAGRSVTLLDREAMGKVKTVDTEIGFMHIAFGWSDKFIDIVNDYVDAWKPRLTVIHSTVPVGTTQFIKGPVVFSPVRGQHPDLIPGIKRFVKYVAGTVPEDVALAVEAMKRAGIPAQEWLWGVEGLEYAKLTCTTTYGAYIAIEQLKERGAKSLGVPYAALEIWRDTYNDGYRELKPEVVRPKIFPGVIGGHCVRPNIELLKIFLKDEPLLDFIEESNKKKSAQYDDRRNV